MTNGLKFTLLLLLLLGLMLIQLLWGSVYVSWSELWAILQGDNSNKSAYTIIWMLRIPKIQVALLAGAALSVSGLLMQTFFRNPIAGPFVLGISSGASLGVALWILATGSLTSIAALAWLQTSTSALAIVAMLGSGLVLALLLVVAWRVRDMNTLLILGLMLGSSTSAIVSLLQYFSSQQALQRFVFWSMGDLTGVTWDELYWLWACVLIGLIASFALSKSLDALLLGEEYAQSMGVAVGAVQRQIIVITAILAGSITAFCGPIAFVGVAVPHLARMWFRTHRHYILVGASILMGMITLLTCQWIAQLPSSEAILPINVITSFLGAPMIMYIVLSRKSI